jgi:murein DD-endopeptidase MepM/ murein hydrolase activator NlpD
MVFILTFLFSYLFSSFFGGLSSKDESIERKKLETQREEIEDLTRQIENQERYVNAIKLILSGEVPVSSDLDSLYEHGDDLFDSISEQQTKSEIELADKVEDDIRMTKENDEISLTYFSSPVVGVVSQKFDKKRHQGIDVVTKKDEAVKACLAGTVIYAGYTRKDGYIVILDHSNGFISVYKHNKTVLKKMGDKVRLGDPVSIVGNTGENTDGPHLHFELWFKQSPVNPADYIKFTK